MYHHYVGQEEGDPGRAGEEAGATEEGRGGAAEEGGGREKGQGGRGEAEAARGKSETLFSTDGGTCVLLYVLVSF